MALMGLMSCRTSPKAEKPQPANQYATDEAKALLERMAALTDRGIMFGHQDDLVYGHAWKDSGRSDVLQVCGTYPAVFGWELGGLELGHEVSLDSVPFEKIRESIRWVHAQGGISTISWHANNPLTGGNAWDVSSDQVVKSILSGGECHAQYLNYLNRLADFFLTLTSNDGQLIPLIFRPYHEHTGSWFWWGQNLCTPEDYISLWTMTVGQLTSRGLNNLLYAYAPTGGFSTREAYLERYPGDNIIDLLGFDTYQRGVEQRERYTQSIVRSMKVLEPLARERHKLLIVAETGLESIPDTTWWTTTFWPTFKPFPISYVLVWRNACDKPEHFYAPFPGQISADDFVSFEKLEQTLFLKDL